MKKLFIISLGGSLINPGKINVTFIKNFTQLILKQTKKGDEFIIVTGGGSICRVYQKALKSITNPSNIDLDWLGIASTKYNAELIRLSFGSQAPLKLEENIYDKKIVLKQKITIAGGYKPGRSSDGAMVAIAKTYGASIVINLSNIDYVYTKDPRKFKDAEIIKSISWKDFRKIAGNKWDPGKNVPFDPTAAKLAQKIKLKVIIANGKNLSNLKYILEEKKFIGTVIS